MRCIHRDNVSPSHLERTWASVWVTDRVIGTPRQDCASAAVFGMILHLFTSLDYQAVRSVCCSVSVSALLGNSFSGNIASKPLPLKSVYLTTLLYWNIPSLNLHVTVKLSATLSDT